MNNYFEIGKIVNTQGLKGDVRVVPMTDDIKRFELLDSVIIKKDKIKMLEEVLEIEKVWYHKNFVILKFKGIDNINQVEKYKNCLLLIPEDKALPLESDEYYIRDLYGLSVVTTAGEKLGIISDIIFTGANDVYAIKNEDKKIKDLLIPAVKQCIVNVNIENKVMTVNLPDGLREI